MCDCRQRLETSLSENYAPQLPEGAQNLQVSMQGYAMMFSGPVASKQYMEAEVTFQAPTKGSKTKPSVMRDRKDRVNVLASFCMFCGEKYPNPLNPKPEASAHEG